MTLLNMVKYRSFGRSFGTESGRSNTFGKYSGTEIKLDDQDEISGIPVNTVFLPVIRALMGLKADTSQRRINVVKQK